MKKLLYKLMEHSFIYRLMPKHTRFIYCVDIMLKNKLGRLYLENGCVLNFENMMIELSPSSQSSPQYISNTNILDVEFFAQILAYAASDGYDLCNHQDVRKIAALLSNRVEEELKRRSE